MKFFKVVFGILCVVLVSKSEDHHHIEQRVLDTQGNTETIILPENSETNITNKSLSISNDAKVNLPFQNSSAISTPRGPSNILEQQLNNALGTSSSSFSIPLNQTVGSTDLPQVEDLSNGILAPKIFPNGTSINGTKILEGDSEKLQTLIWQQNYTTEKSKNDSNVENKNQTMIDTEVKDLLNNTANQEDFSHQQPMESQEPKQVQEQFNDDTESIETGRETEDQIRNHEKSDINDEPAGLQQRYLAAILVSSLVAASVICYAALLVWRRYLENRYGSRTMLVNEEEFDDPSDLRHFSI